MVLVLIPLVWLVSYIFIKGIVALRPSFFVHDQRGVTPTMPATAGGGLHAIIGTIEQVGIALLISLPLGAAAAFFLNESRSRLRRPVRIFVDAMSGMPSIVSGLFIYATLIIPLAKDNSLFGFDGFMASLALSMTMMPTICRAIEVVLRLVPDGLREAGLALGASRARVVVSVVLPTASTGVATAAILGIAREAGETAPLLFTAFGYNLYNSNPFSGAQESLPLFIYRFVRTQSVADIERGYAGALVLLVLILSLFVVARIIGRDRSVASRRQARVRPARQPSLLVSTAQRQLAKPAQTFHSMRTAHVLRSMRPARGEP
jgi:phosphate transport system permease protein